MQRGAAERGVSPVIGVILMVAITVILGALVGTLALGLGSETEETGPRVSISTDQLDADGADDQEVRFTHENGDTLDVSNLEIVVRLEETGATTRLVNLPVTSDIDASEYEGDNILDQRVEKFDGAITDDLPDTDGEWSSGDFIEFRIKESDDGYDIAPGDEVTVRIVHTPSGEAVVRETLVAE